MTEEKDKKKKGSFKRAMRVFRYVRPYRGAFALGFVFLFLTGGTALIFPSLIGDLVDSANEKDLSEINGIALILLYVFIAQAVFSYFRIYLFTYVTQNALAGLRKDVYSHLIKLPMSFFNTNRVGELNSRISSDVSLLQETFTTTLAEFLRQLIIIVGGVIFISMISPQLTLFMLAIVPVMALAAVFFGRFIRKLSKKTQEKVAESNTIVEETFQGVENVKSFANEWYEIGRYGNKVKEVVKIGVRAGMWRGAFASFIIFVIFAAIVGVMWRGSVLVQDPESGLTVGELFKFVLYTVFMGASIGGIAAQYSQIQSAIGSTEHLLDLLDEQPEPVSTDPVEPIHIHGDVEFEKVEFHYPSRTDIQVLRDVSFKVSAGQQIAIVGPSGSGKSTIVSLLLRYYDPSSGSIKIDGKPASEYDLTALRNQMAIVPQEVLLFGGTITENIAYGKPGCSQEEIVAAAEKANAAEFINEFPETYDTIVGERGVQLSGGQRQRIAIARAVLKDPSILVLDEATSSLDSESERVVQEALEKLMENRTSFVIAHRLSTIKNADVILVIENGKLVEMGTHDELIAGSEGVYKGLSELQFKS